MAFQVDVAASCGDRQLMTGKCGLTREHVARILGNESLEHAARCLQPDMETLLHVPAGSAKISAERARALWEEIGGLRLPTPACQWIPFNVSWILIQHPHNASPRVNCRESHGDKILGPVMPREPFAFTADTAFLTGKIAWFDQPIWRTMEVSRDLLSQITRGPQDIRRTGFNPM